MRARGWRGQQSGEYTLVRRWRWAAAALRVFEAVHTRRGTPAVVLKPGRVGDWAPSAAPWRALVSSTPEHLAVELAPHPSGAAQLQEVTLGLHRLANALAQVDTEPAAQSALAGEVASLRVWRARWSARPAYVAALAAVALLGVVAAPRVEHAASMTSPATSSPVQLAPLAPAEPLPVSMMQRPEWGALALPMPPKPFDGQARPGKNGKCARRGEVAINDGCWQALRDVPPPCEGDAYEWKGACYLPVTPAGKDPRAALRGSAEIP